MPSSRRGALAMVVALVLSPVLPAVAATAATAAQPAPSSTPPAATAFTADVPVGDVLSSRLAHLAQKADPSTPLPTMQGHAAGTLPISAAGDGEGSVQRIRGGKLLVEVRLEAGATAGTVDAVVAAGAQVIAPSGGTASLTVAVADDHLVALAKVDGVRSVREIITPAVGDAHGALDTPAAPASSSAAPSAAAAATCPTGVVSEGDAQLRAAIARQTYGVDGAGVKVGVLSDSYDLSPTATKRAASDVSAGDLPGAGNPCATTPVQIQTEFDPSIPYIPTDEGRAMLQIVHDLAPGSPLSFASVFKGEADMANQIRTMAANGADIILDDVSYATEPLYQDGPIAQAINDVTKAGTTYLSAAGNSNLVIGGKDVTSYEATAGYRPTPCPAGPRLDEFGAQDCHDFDPGPGTSSHDTITLPPNTVLQIELGWSEPINGVTNDLDVFLVDEANPGKPEGSNNNSIVLGTPTEWFRYQNLSPDPQTLDLYVTRKSGSTGTPRFKFIFQRPSAPSAVEWDTSQGTDVVGPSAYGHNAALSAGTVGAVAFNDSALVEEYSSRGPATYCWAPVDGSANAAPPLPGGCRDKPIDVVASDGVATSFFAYLDGPTWRFYGTSSSTPHVAAIAALARQHNPCRTPAEVLAALRASGRPVDGYGPGAVGSGLVDAPGTIAALAPCGLSLPDRMSAAEGQVVTIDWSKSLAPQLTSTFVQKSGPTPTAVRSTGPGIRKIVVPRSSSATGPTDLTFAVTVADPTSGQSATADVVVSVANVAPVASASAPGAVVRGAPTLLTGLSTDAGEPDQAPQNGVGREFRWRQIEGPAVTLSPGRGVGFRDASFSPTTAGRYRFGLTVVDHGGLGASSAESVVSIDVRDAATAGSLSGIIRDEHGTPLGGALVLIYHQAADGWKTWAAVSGADGRWTVTGVPDRANFVLLAGKLGYATRATRNHIDLGGLPTVQSPSSTADFTLPTYSTLHSISGSLRTSSGAAAIGVPVELSSPDGQIGHATSDWFGNYRFDGLADSDRYRVRVVPSDQSFDPVWIATDGRGSSTWLPQPSTYLTLAAGNLVVPATTVYRPGERRTLDLTVRGPGGAVVPGAEVRVYSAGGYRTLVAIVRTDANGHVAVTGLRPDTYTLWTDPGSVAAPQWLGGVVGFTIDGSGQLADGVSLLTSDATVTFALTGSAQG